MDTKTTRWMPLFLTQAFGVLNDNLLKGAISFISVMWVPLDMRASVLALASGLLVAPYLMASPWAARLSIRFSKAKVVQWAKFAELPIMAIAVCGFYFENLLLSMVALWLMGLQSAVYSPSKYGLIKDVGGTKGINFGTGMMELLTFAGVLLGMVFAGFIADLGAAQKPVLIAVFLSLALVGWISSVRIRAIEPAHEKTFEGPINPIKFFASTWKKAGEFNGLKSTLIGLGIFWLMGTLLQLVLLIHLPEQYGLSASGTALVISAVALGIGVGCWSAGIITRHRVEPGMAVVGAAGMTLFIGLMAFAPLSLTGFVLCAVGAAFFSGWYKVPLNAWVQVRVKGRKLGSVLGLQNMVLSAFVFLAAGIFQLASVWMSTNGILAICAVVAMLTALVTLIQMPAFVIRFVVFFLSRVIYRVKIRGLENIPKEGGALVVANHVSYLDFMLLVAAFPRQLRFVMLKDMYEKKSVNWLLKRMNMIPINARGGKNDLNEFNRLCQEQINDGHVVCIFSEGTVTRTGQTLTFQKGVEHISAGTNAPIIPVHLGDVLGTPLSFSSGKSRMERLRLSNMFGKVQVSVGAPLQVGAKAFEIRQAILELEASSFDADLEKSSVGAAIYQGLRKHDFKISHAHHSTSSKDLLRKSLAYANELEPRLAKESAVAVMLPKGIDNLALNCALQFLAKPVVHINPDHIPDEREHILRKSNAQVLITTKDREFTRFAPFAQTVLYVEELEINTSLTRHIANWLDRNVFGLQRFRVKRTNPNQAVALLFEQEGHHQFKAVALTQRNVLAQLKAIKRLFNHTSGKTILSDLEYSTAFGFFLEFVLPLCKGLNHVVGSGGKDFTSQFNLHQPSDVLCTQEQLNQLLASEPDLGALKDVYTDSAKMDSQARMKLQEAGVNCFSSAGLNESCSVFCLNTLGYQGIDIAGKPLVQEGFADGSVGRPLPGLALKVVNPENLDEVLAPGEKGLVLVKGATVVKEYLDHCRDWSKDFYKDWFITPLQGYLNYQGFLVLE